MIINPFYIYLYHVANYVHSIMNWLLIILGIFGLIVLLAIFLCDNSKVEEEDKYNIAWILKWDIALFCICVFIKTFCPTTLIVKNMILADAINKIDLNQIELLKNIINEMLK